jgi:ABC-type nitrate/sulfonate/bicarbonate transport system permease component
MTAPPVPIGRVPIRRVLSRAARSVATAAVSIGVALLVWQGFIWIFHVDHFIGRTPHDVWKYLTTADGASENRRLLLDATLTTFRDAALGFTVGTIAAVTVAVAFALKRGIEQTLLPIAMALRSVPLLAMAPLIALIFGRDLMAVTVIAGIVTFFPTLVNVSIALRAVPASMSDLMRAYGSTPALTIRKVQFPHALPELFASIRIAAPLALVGALLAEWLTTGKGLGYLMLQSSSVFEFDRVWASVAIVTISSVVLYNIICAVESTVLAKYAPDRVATS